MLRPQPTTLTLKQEDLKEYENARASWVLAEQAKNEGGLAKSNEATVDNKGDKRHAVRTRIGISK